MVEVPGSYWLPTSAATAGVGMRSATVARSTPEDLEVVEQRLVWVQLLVDVLSEVVREWHRQRVGVRELHRTRRALPP